MAKSEAVPGAIVHVTAGTFDGVVTSERAVLPVLDEIAQEYGDRVTIGKVNVDEEPTLAGRFGVRSIPTLMFFKDGALQVTVVGAVPKAEIVKRLDALK